MEPGKEDRIVDATRSRLDDIFGDLGKRSDPGAPAGTRDTPQTAEDLTDLKSVVLSLDWEITESLLDRLISESSSLAATYGGDPVLAPLFKILGAVGKFVRSRREKTPPEAMSLLNSVFYNIEHLIVSEFVEESDKKDILKRQVARFQDLKATVARGDAAVTKTAASAPEPPTPEPETPPARDGASRKSPAGTGIPVSPSPAHSPPRTGATEPPGATALETALGIVREEVVRIVRREIEALKAELQAARKPTD